MTNVAEKSKKKRTEKHLVGLAKQRSLKILALYFIFGGSRRQKVRVGCVVTMRKKWTL